MKKQNLPKKENLTGKYVIVTSKSLGKLVKREGIIYEYKTRSYLLIKLTDDTKGYVVFAGSAEGIYQIKDEENKLLYKNSRIPEVYEAGMEVNHKLQTELRSEGKFFLD